MESHSPRWGRIALIVVMIVVLLIVIIQLMSVTLTAK